MHNLRIPYRQITVASASLVLTACSGLHNVDHKWCPPEAAATPAPTQETVNLQADTLFRFDGSQLKDMLPAGRAQLDSLANHLIEAYVHIDHIALKGYTDRLGPKAYNQRLSQARANTVRDYLLAHGVHTPMTAIGMGESDPVTTICQGNKASARLIACLQPDRRVVVHVQGTKKLEPDKKP